MTSVQLLASFKLFLQTQGYAASTIKNYLSDLNRYYSLFPTLSADSLIIFLTQESTTPNYPRTLASLRLFCQFAIDQNLISINPLKTALKATSATPQPNIDQIITDFTKYLASKHASLSTIKNYINDVTQYINWLKLESH